MSLNNSSITQSIGIPYQQYVTSSAGHTLVSSSTYFNTGEWLNESSFLVLESDKFELKKF